MEMFPGNITRKCYHNFKSNPMNEKNLSIKDIAKLSDVGITTVSRYLNTPDLVKPYTRDKIKKVIEEVGYYPSGIARGMRNRKTKNLVIFLETIESPFYIDVLFGAEQCAVEKGYNLFIFNYNKDKNKKEFCKDILFNRNYDGVVFCCDIDKNDEILFKRLLDNGIEIVFINAEIFKDKFNLVSINNYQAAFDGTQYLINKGHQKIALVSSNITKFLFDIRIHGCRDALKQNSIDIDDSSIYETDLSIYGGYMAAQEISKHLEKYTAIFCLSDFIALGIINYFNENNIRVPDDISLLGFDDIMFSKITYPPLTTIHQKKKKLGYLAVEKLIGLLNKELKGNISIVLDTYLVERKSVKDIKVVNN